MEDDMVLLFGGGEEALVSPALLPFSGFGAEMRQDLRCSEKMVLFKNNDAWPGMSISTCLGCGKVPRNQGWKNVEECVYPEVPGDSPTTSNHSVKH